MSDTNDFLLEIGTEELPAKRMREVAAVLAANVEKGLKHHSLAHKEIKFFVTPRRLAVLVSGLVSKQPDQHIELRGPAAKIAYDEFGDPTTAAHKFAASCGVEITKLERHKTEKGEWVVCRTQKAGVATEKLLPEIINQAVKCLPVAKQMRWGDGKITFIRPVHWLVLLYGTTAINAEILGVNSSNKTFGHRFLYPQEIVIPEPSRYEELLEKTGKVIADFDKRLQIVRTEVQNATKSGTPLLDEDLLIEVTGLVEWPVVLVGTFDKHFLEIPQEVLITSLQHQQRCFPVVNAEGKLLPIFIVISNIVSKDPRRVIEGNERVIRARLTDAEFFYRTDSQFTLDSYLERLKLTVFQNKLGSVYDKTQRLIKLSIFLAQKLNVNESQASRAALLAKCDLMATMVWEFPELQGIMGYYYALAQFEPDVIAIALKEQYLPRFAKDKIPESVIGCILAIADRADTLVGLFGMNKLPTGEKDPLGLRRAAAGILRIILEKNIDLDLLMLFTQAKEFYAVVLENAEVVQQVMRFIYERLRAWYLENGGSANVFSAVLARNPTNLIDFKKRLDAVTFFQTLPEAETLSLAHKRVNNILTKAELPTDAKFNNKLAKESEEKILAKEVMEKIPVIQKLCQERDYNGALRSLADLKPAIDNFFDKIMVMDENKKLRINRLCLLKDLHELFISVADISLI